MLEGGTISPEDMELMLVTDDTAEAIQYIRTRLAAAEGARQESAAD
jgi:predicted Rossmann-fold nucleotide-binding protein